MAKNGKGKTKTIKKRAIYVYLPSLEMAEDWKRRAAKAGTSISRYVTERVQDSIRREEGEEGYLSRLDLITRLRESEEEVKRLRDDNRLLRKLVDNLDRELKRYRTMPFTLETFEGVRGFERDLVELLRRRKGRLSEDEILSGLGIDPADVDLVKGVARQLQALEAYGLVEFVGRGWRWKD